MKTKRKPIRVDGCNVTKITAVIDEVQSRARVRTICCADVFDAVAEMERRLASLLYKKDWLGIAVEVDLLAQSFPSAYKGTPESTQFRLIRWPSGWFVDDIHRDVTGRTEYICSLLDKGKELAQFANDKFADM